MCDMGDGLGQLYQLVFWVLWLGSTFLGLFVFFLFRKRREAHHGIVAGGALLVMVAAGHFGPILQFQMCYQTWPPDPARFERIDESMTMKEVIDLLGPPQVDWHYPDGRRTMRYYADYFITQQLSLDFRPDGSIRFLNHRR